MLFQVMPWTVLRVGFEAERRQVRFLLGAPSLCESGGMVYTADLKSAAERLTGSSPVSRTKLMES